MYHVLQALFVKTNLVEVSTNLTSTSEWKVYETLGIMHSSFQKVILKTD